MDSQMTGIAPYQPNRSLEIGLPAPDQLQALEQFCSKLNGSPFLPRTLVRDTDSSRQTATLLAVVLTGREMGLSPMQSLRAYWMSPDGRLGMYADSMLAVMLSRGAKFKWLENTTEKVSLQGVRGDYEYTATWTKKDAEAAQLWTKDIWRKYPRNMLRARVISEMFRTLCPDFGGAQMYSQEELQDMDETPQQSYREQAHAEADAVAQEDPALKIAVAEQVKPIATAVSTQTIPGSESVTATAETEVATSASLPPEPAAPTAKDTYKKLVSEAQSIAKAKVADIKGWLKGWFQPTDTPSPDDYNDALRVLVATLSDYPEARTFLVNDALGMGERMRKLHDAPESAEPETQDDEPEAFHLINPEDNPLDEKIMAATGWNLNTAVLARETLMRRASMSEDKVLNGIKAFGLVGMSNDDAYAYMLMYHHSADATLLCREWADAKPSAILTIVQKEAGIPNICLDTDSQKVDAAVLNLIKTGENR